MNLSAEGYAVVGVILLTIIGWLLKWWIAKTLDARFARKEASTEISSVLIFRPFLCCFGMCCLQNFVQSSGFIWSIWG